MTVTTAPHLLTPSRARLASWLLAAQTLFQLVVVGTAVAQRGEFLQRVTGTSLAPTHDAAVGTWQSTLGVHLFLAALFALGAVRIRGRRPSTRLRVSIPLVLTSVGGLLAMTLPVPTYLSPIGVALAVAALAALWLPGARA